jgi:hypothetical protein
MEKSCSQDVRLQVTKVLLTTELKNHNSARILDDKHIRDGQNNVWNLRPCLQGSMIVRKRKKARSRHMAECRMREMEN